MKRILPISFLSALLLLTLSIRTQAQGAAVPGLMNFQGRLAKPDGTPVADGNVSIRFSLHDAASGGNEKWTQTITTVSVRQGAFAVLLSGFPAGTFGSNLWLEIKVGSDAPLTPRQPLVTVAYAMKANSVPDGSIGTNSLADNAITSLKTASDAATLNRVSGGALTSSGGKIGLGTTAPGTPLEVLGYSNQLRLRGGDYSNALLDFSATGVGGGWAASIQARNDNGTLAGPASLFINGAGGNVGIGTGAPATALHVRGNTQYRTLTVESANEAGIQWRSGTSAKTWTMLSAADGQVYLTSDLTAPLNSFIFNANGTLSLPVLDVRGGSDIAEPFEIHTPRGISSTIVPGMVVCIDAERPGELCLSTRTYDSTVAGIISGAGGVKVGLTLHQDETLASGKIPVAMTGRVWCWCDADANGPITPGNLLTTSPTPGHAMRATNPARSHGAVLGKAMSALKSGKGLVLVLVRPQ